MPPVTMQKRDGVPRPRSTSFGLGLLLGALVGVGWLLESELGWDERTTAELEFDAWADRGGLSVYARECLDDRPRPDGRVPCSAVFASSDNCGPGLAYCGAKRATIWCATDSTRGEGCVWP